MKTLLRLEELLMFALALFLFSGLNASLRPFAHFSLDRAFGYGLKREEAFQNTHMGRIGR